MSQSIVTRRKLARIEKQGGFLANIVKSLKGLTRLPANFILNFANAFRDFSKLVSYEKALSKEVLDLSKLKKLAGEMLPIRIHRAMVGVYGISTEALITLHKFDEKNPIKSTFTGGRAGKKKVALGDLVKLYDTDIARRIKTAYVSWYKDFDRVFKVERTSEKKLAQEFLDFLEQGSRLGKFLYRFLSTLLGFVGLATLIFNPWVASIKYLALWVLASDGFFIGFGPDIEAAEHISQVRHHFYDVSENMKSVKALGHVALSGVVALLEKAFYTHFHKEQDFEEMLQESKGKKASSSSYITKVCGVIDAHTNERGRLKRVAHLKEAGLLDELGKTLRRIVNIPKNLIEKIFHAFRDAWLTIRVEFKQTLEKQRAGLGMLLASRIHRAMTGVGISPVSTITLEKFDPNNPIKSTFRGGEVGDRAQPLTKVVEIYDTNTAKRIKGAYLSWYSDYKQILKIQDSKPSPNTVVDTILRALKVGSKALYRFFSSLLIFLTPLELAAAEWWSMLVDLCLILLTGERYYKILDMDEMMDAYQYGYDVKSLSYIGMSPKEFFNLYSSQMKFSFLTLLTTLLEKAFYKWGVDEEAFDELANKQASYSRYPHLDRVTHTLQAYAY